MTKGLGRRGFLKTGIIALGSAAAGAWRKDLEGFPRVRLALDGAASAGTAGPSTIAVVTGSDYGRGAARAVDLVGGMGAFVPKGARVAILANSQSRHPGAFTSPDVLASVIRMCRDAGASEIDCLSWLDAKNWQGSGLDRVVSEAGARLVLVERKDESFRSVPVPKGVALKQAAVMAELSRHDVLVDVPITKDHAGNKFTGTLKNLMGLNAPSSNRTFHKDEKEPGAIAHLDQCIADLNTVITPHLCVVDATEYIVTNGPFGPGEILKSRKVVAGTDRVAIDGYCTTLRAMRPEDIVMIRKAYEHGLGEIDLSKVRVLEAAV